jgi:hypothetical protein
MKPLLTAPLRVIGLQLTPDEFNTWGTKHLLYGVLLAWLAGMGRYWDNPRADLWQHLGLGSVAYVFALGLFLYLLLWPLKPQNWKFAQLMTMLAFTSPLAFLYALPVERWMPRSAAASLNGWFLFIVALWRVMIYGRFLSRVAGLASVRFFIGLLLPLAFIVAGLAALNLEHAVFQLMGGLREGDRTSADNAYHLVLALSYLSILASPFLLILYVCAIVSAWKTARRSPAPDDETPQS